MTLHAINSTARGDAERIRFHVQSIGDLSLETRNSWIWKGVIPDRGLGAIFGQPKCGKSFYALDVALKISAGLEISGRKVRQSGAIYVCAEGGRGFIRRVIAAQERLKLKPEIPFGLICESPDLGSDESDLKPLIAAIQKASDERGWRPSLIILDTLARTIGGLDESKPSDLSVYVRNVSEIEAAFNACVLIVHHSGVSDHGRMRGSNVLLAACDFVIGLEAADDGRKIARLDFIKDAEAGLQASFRLEKVELGNDEDGDPITTLVVNDLSEFDLPDISKQKKERPMPEALKLFMSVFDQVIGSAGQPLKPWPNGPEVRAIRRDDLREPLFERLPDETNDNKRQRLFSGLKGASNRQLISSRVIDGVTWLWRV